MKILVTGAGGFAGRNIVQYFASQGEHRVVGTYRRHRPDTITNAEMLQLELSDEIDIDGNFDAIIHTACARPGKGHTFRTFKRDNIDSMEQLIAFAQKKGIKTFINLSTKSVYGEGFRSEDELHEDAGKKNQDAYGLTKYAAECLLKDETDMNGISLRLPGISGPGAHDIWLVSMVEKIMKDEPITVSDFITKNFVWIYDIARFADKLIRHSLEGNRFKYDVVNLACRKGSRNVDLVNEIKRRTNSKSELIIQQPDKSLPVLNAARALEMGFDPHDPMEITDMYLDTLGL